MVASLRARIQPHTLEWFGVFIIFALGFLFAALIFKQDVVAERRDTQALVHVCDGHGGVSQSLGVGTGTHEMLGIECADGESLKVGAL